MGIDVPQLRLECKDPNELIETSDGRTLFLRKWEASTPSEASRKYAILILHGITAHSGAYQIIAAPMSKAGYTIFGVDYRGHGLSDGKRGDFPGRERFIKDICETINFLKQRFPKLILFGHSLGVLVAIETLREIPQEIDGLMLFSGARTVRSGVYHPIPLFTKLKIGLSSLFFPSKPVVEYRREGMVGLDDPLFTFRYTYRFMKFVFSTKELMFLEKLVIPVYFGIGDQDELFSVEDAHRLFDEIPAADKEFEVISGAKHAKFPDGSWEKTVEWLQRNFQ